MTVSHALAPTAPSNGCRLVAADGRVLPLTQVSVDADAGGGLAAVRLRQTFVNPYAEPLAVTYLLPLPADGAVVDFAFVLAGRRVAGRVARKADARAAFEQAVLEGRTASLLEQERSSLFTQEIGNLPPGATLEVEITVEQPLAWVDGGWEWRWPTVVGPRYLGAPGETPDAEKVVVDVAPWVPTTCAALLRVSDALTGAPTSPSHPLGVGDAGIQLGGLLDRDLVVRWPVAAPAPGLTLEVGRPVGDDDAYGLLTLVPPAVAGIPVARDLCLLLDTSGSMGGTPLAQAVAFATALVNGLRSGDQLELIEFSDQPRRFRPAPVRVDAASRAEALRWLSALRARGGTAMHEAVTEALRPLRADAQRQVVLVTDGYIGFEAEVIRRIREGLPRGARIHTVGIGSSVNRTLTGGVARAGGGHEAIVGPDEPVGTAVSALLARTGDPLWIDVTVSGSALRQQAPAAIPDLLAGAPSRISVRLAPEGGTLVVTARTAAGPVVHEVAVTPAAVGAGRRVLATRFAREAVEDLELAFASGGDGRVIDAAIEALGLRHAIATRLTSWVAATEEATVDPSDPTRSTTMPHALPYGVSAEGVGLRALAAPTAGPLGAPAVARSMMAPAPAGPPPVGGAMRGRAPSPEQDRRVEPKAKKAEAPKPRLVADEESAVFAGPLREEAADAPEPARRPAPARVIRARRSVLADGRVVVTFEVDAALDWSPEDAVAVHADGRRLGLTPVVGTTRAGAVAAGATVRLVLEATVGTPVRIELPGLVLELA